jgi:hypothetical protein
MENLRRAAGPPEIMLSDNLDVVILVDRLETIEAIREGMKQIDEGQGMSLEEFKNAVHKKHGIRTSIPICRPG